MHDSLFNRLCLALDGYEDDRHFCLCKFLAFCEEKRSSSTNHVREKCHKPFCLFRIPLSCAQSEQGICLSLHYQKMTGEIVSTDTATPLMRSQNERLKVFLHALLFVAGFSLVFIVGWGGSVTLVGQFFGAYKRIIAQIGGVVVIHVGLATLGVIRLPWFYADTRAQFSGRTWNLWRLSPDGHFLRRWLESHASARRLARS